MKALKKSYSGLAVAVLFLIIVLAGCNSTSNKDKKANEAVADTIRKEVILSPESQSLLYKFPTPFEVTMMLEKAKAGFIFDITNSPTNVTKYSTEKSKAINLGVYSADLSYSATYNRTDETNKFLACTNKLADELGIAGVYDQNLLDKIKKYNNNKDSLVALINKVFGQTNDFLSKNNRNQIAVLIAAGGFAEGLYLAAYLGLAAKDNTKITAVIADQKANFDKLLTILQAYNQDQNMKPIADEVAKLAPVWTNYGVESGKKLPKDKAIAVNDLTASVRDVLVK
ncbi:MAG: hypothetical protein M0Q38_03960 [Bacteroidales bacterium]|jgi:hypothetical protein|nr:hypothetical protein [Bacteroidales bacterium]